MALNAGDSACTMGLSGAMYANWTGDTAHNGFSSPLSGPQATMIKSMCYQFALAIVAQIQANATLTIPNSAAGDGMQTSATPGSATTRPSPGFSITGAIT